MPQAFTAITTSSSPALGVATSSTWTFLIPRNTAAFIGQASPIAAGATTGFRAPIWRFAKRPLGAHVAGNGLPGAAEHGGIALQDVAVVGGHQDRVQLERELGRIL